jgi:hypothetical protein
MTKPALTYDAVIPAAHQLLEDCDEIGHSIILGMALVKVLKRVPHASAWRILRTWSKPSTQG